MAPERENLIKLIEQLPEGRLADAERLLVQMLREGEPASAPPGMSFEEATAHVFETHDALLRKLAQ